MVKLVNRARMSTSTTGTGTITLGSAENGYQSFDDAGVPDGDVIRYVIEDGANWEIGTGTYTASGTTLTRTVTESSNSDAALNLSGNAIVFIGPAAQDFSPTITLAGDASGSVTLTDLEDATLTVTVADDSHNHVIANVDGLQADLDAKLDKSGGTMTGNLILNADPTTALGAATKEYVDTIAAAGIHYHDPVRVESPSNLNATYDNGTSGVGATLTNAGTQAALVIDGVTLSTSDRVLVYTQTNAAHNGIYTVTDTGSASTNWVLTRATDADSYGASDPDAMGEGDAFFVKEGATGAGELYVMNTSGTITFGTTAITFTVIAETAVYTAGTDLTLTGTTFSVNSTIAANTTGNAATATALETARTIGGVSFDGTANINLAGVNTTGNQDTTGNAATASAWQTARTITLSGDVSGTATGVDGSGNVTITTTVADDSHAHVISNVDGLQTALDAKAPTASPTFSGTVTFPAGQTFDGRDLSVDGAKLDGIESGATADQTAAEIRTLVESATDSNVFTDADHTKLNGISSGAEVNQNAFSNVAVSGQTTVAADGKTDTLTLAAGSNVTITTNASTDTVTIASTDTNTTYSAGSGLTLSGTTFSHTDTSSQASLTALTGAAVVSDIDVDTYGHVTNLATRNLTLANLGYTGETNATADQTASEILTAIKTVDGSGSGLDADTVDGVQGSSFLRSDANDTATGELTFNAKLDVADGTYLGWGGGTNRPSITGNKTSNVMLHYTGGSERLRVNNTGIDVTGDVTADNVYVANAIYHEGDTNTYVSFGTDIVYVVSAGSTNHEFRNTYTQTFKPFYQHSVFYEDYDALSGTSVTVNCDTAQAFSLTMTGNTTFTFNSVTNAWSTGFVLELTGNGGTVTWPPSVDWAGGTKPDAPASGETDLYVFWTRDGGTTWYGMLAIDAAA